MGQISKSGSVGFARLLWAVPFMLSLTSPSLGQVVTQEGKVLGILRFQTLGIVGYVAAAVMGLWLLVSIIRGKKI